MGTTFRCWVIANFEIAMFWISLIILIISLYIGTPTEQFRDTGTLIMSYVAFSILCTYPTEKGAFQYGRYAFMLLLGIAGTLNPDSSQDEIIIVWMFWLVFTVASLIALWLAIYTYHNIDEVLSRRMLYRNSNVSLFEFTWKYVLDRFCNITVSIVYHSLWILLVLFSLATGKLF